MGAANPFDMSACRCQTCRDLDAIKVREVTWCMDCGKREVGEGLTRCVMCEAAS